MVIRLVLLFILLALRFYMLDVRPPHHDEAVNGWFIDGIFNRGYYQYDPANYHGPLFFYIESLFRMLFGRTVPALRIPIVLFSWVMTMTPLLFRKWIGDRAAWFAVFFLAVSPAMVFFSRYAIHEMEFALASILFFYYWVRTREHSFTRANTIGLGVTLGAMATLKENFVIYVGCLFTAEFVVAVYERFFPKYSTLPPKQELEYFRDLKRTGLGVLSVIAIAFAMIWVTFSAFGRDENGLSNFFRAFYLWSETGSKGNGHQKPFDYWLKILIQLEWFAMIGLILTPLVVKKTQPFLRFISVLGFGMWLAYSIVSYKTPWCVLSYYWTLILVAGYWTAKLSARPGWKWPVMLAFVAGCGLSISQAYDVAYENPDQEGHYYIYGQTYREFMTPLNEIVARAEAHPELKASLKMEVISTFTWPLPYILGEFKQVGYYGEQNAPAVLTAEYVFIDEALDQKYAPRLQGNYSRTVVKARQWASRMVIYSKQQ